MATKAVTPQGYSITINGIEIGEVTGFALPTVSKPKITVTHLKSTAVETINGLRDNGSFSFSCNYVFDDPGQVEIERVTDLSENQAFEIVPPGAGIKRSFLGQIEEAAGDAAAGEAMTREFTISVSGGITNTTIA